jgi:general secretion pathway protein F
MITYQFKAVGQDGRVRTGSLNGESEKKVIAELRKQGLTPVYVGTQPQGRTEWKLPKLQFGKRKDVLFFTQELSTLLNSGVPLDRALAITTELTARAEFKGVVNDVLRSVKGGKSLADALGTKPEYFADFYINMVRAGEASGSLGAIFERLSEYETTRDELKGYIISSMIYPALLSLVGVATIVLMLYFVVPRFAAVFSDSRMKIPTPTLILLEVSRVVRAYGGWALGALVLAAVGFRQYISSADGKLWWHGFTLRIPVLGDALRKAQTSQFARAMGTLVSNGVPLVQCLGISRAIMSNLKMSGTLEMVAQGVKRGEGLSGPISKAGAFPPLLAHLLSIGEETGRLDAMFLRAAEIYDGETRAAIKRFTALFEPLIILVLGVAVGALILSMLLAITSINEVAV